ncbi:MAG: aldolase/citrate lyase family protein [Negativicutes bacterium]|nr:aldolase/citrate lyase family protein [Negativicutes bacterium]
MKLMRTMLFVPGNDPGKLLNAGIYKADSVVFDLEDAVSVYEKDAARDLVRNALKYNEYPCDIGVRVNHISTPFGNDDLEELMKVRPAFFRLPKSEDEADIVKVDQLITAAERKYGYEAGVVKFVLTIETAKGIMNSYRLASASKRVIAIGIGAEDLAADLQADRSKEGTEILFARSQLLLSARAAGVQALDNVFADISDEEGFRADTQFGKKLGFSGKSVIHPSQVPIVHAIYSPTENEITKAKKVIAAYQEALSQKSGVIALDGKMIDGPIVTRAERTLRYAQAVGMIKEGEGK